MNKVVASNGHGKCGQPSRQTGQPCKKPAGWGTDHVGQGKCRIHGGSAWITHGRYSTIKRAELRELIEQYERDPDPLNALPELAATRALFVDFVNRYNEFTDALLAWHLSFSAAGRPISQYSASQLASVVDEYEALLRENTEPDAEQEKQLEQVRAFVGFLQQPPDEGKPRRVLDISAARQLIDSLTQQIDAIKKREEATHISKRDFFRVLGEMGNVVNVLIEDDALKQKIKDKWLDIRLPA